MPGVRCEKKKPEKSHQFTAADDEGRWSEILFLKTLVILPRLSLYLAFTFWFLLPASLSHTWALLLKQHQLPRIAQWNGGIRRQGPDLLKLLGSFQAQQQLH